MKRNLVILVVAVAALAISIKFFPYHCNCQPRIAWSTPSVDQTVPSVQIGSTTIAVDIADTPALREQGLSGRKSPAEGRGMVFIFDTPGTYGFWMKDMNFPLDIIWIDSTKRIVSCEKSLAPSTYPKVFYPKSEVLYVLEVPSGFCDAHKIDTGLKISFGT